VRPKEAAGYRQGRNGQSGFSLVEMMVALVILMGVAAIVMSGMMQMMLTQGTVQNRTEMHSSVRSATELLQQEIGQAGRVTLYGAGTGATTLTTPVTTVATPVSVTVGDATGMFDGEQLLIDTGDNEETVKISSTSWTTNSFQASFALAHASNAPVRVAGAFASGIVPMEATCSGGSTCGSTGTLLKMYGDINDDGNMVYVEYSCDTAGGNLYRNVVNMVPGAAKPSVTSSMIVLSNLLPNPPDPGVSGAAPCFKYQEMTVSPNIYVVDVSVTLTVQTQNKDPQTHQFQQETKALLNVSPRNIFDAWELASLGQYNRIQPTPSLVTSLLP
jgi:prepilin-type N-terminal cleavage/methylation domain-containing protein